MKEKIKEIKLWKEKTKGIFHITEYTKFWNYITNLQEELFNEKERFNDYLIKEISYKQRNEKAIEFIEEKISSTKGVINDYMYHKEHNKILIELLQEDIEFYKKELNILKGDKDE